MAAGIGGQLGVPDLEKLPSRQLCRRVYVYGTIAEFAESLNVFVLQRSPVRERWRRLFPQFTDALPPGLNLRDVSVDRDQLRCPKVSCFAENTATIYKACKDFSSQQAEHDRSQRQGRATPLCPSIDTGVQV